MHRLSLAQAKVIIAGAMAEAARTGMSPLTLAVFDPGANLIALRRQDGAPAIGPKIVEGKANGALAFGASSRQLGDMAAMFPQAFGPIASHIEGGLVPAAGALIVKDGEGHIVGAVSVSGDTADNDEIAARAGIAAAGLMAVG